MDYVNWLLEVDDDDAGLVALGKVQCTTMVKATY